MPPSQEHPTSLTVADILTNCSRAWLGEPSDQAPDVSLQQGVCSGVPVSAWKGLGYGCGYGDP